VIKDSGLEMRNILSLQILNCTLNFGLFWGIMVQTIITVSHIKLYELMRAIGGWVVEKIR
jgi:hypothetical protein